MRVWAVSDIHTDYPQNLAWAQAWCDSGGAAFKEDAVILAGAQCGGAYGSARHVGGSRGAQRRPPRPAPARGPSAAASALILPGARAAAGASRSRSAGLCPAARPPVFWPLHPPCSLLARCRPCTGDISDSLEVLEKTLRMFAAAFGYVFYTPGNHGAQPCGQGLGGVARCGGADARAASVWDPAGGCPAQRRDQGVNATQRGSPLLPTACPPAPACPALQTCGCGATSAGATPPCRSWSCCSACARGWACTRSRPAWAWACGSCRCCRGTTPAGTGAC